MGESWLDAALVLHTLYWITMQEVVSEVYRRHPAPDQNRDERIHTSTE